MAGGLGVVWVVAMLAWNASQDRESGPVFSSPIFWFGLVALVAGWVVWGGGKFTRAPTSPAEPAPVTHAKQAGAIPDQIEKLANLRDKGILSKAEFDTKKKELLARL